MRLVIHAGFHKTGTTSVQSMIRSNWRPLKRCARCHLKPAFAALTDAAREFSLTPDAIALADVAATAAEFFKTLDRDDSRPVLMSSEDLAGHMPGRHGLSRYDAAPLLMAQLAEAAYDTLGSATELAFHFSTRDADAWLRSTWWQNLRVTRMTDDFDQYAAQHAAAADLDAVVAAVAEAVPPASVTATPLELSSAMPLGPVTPLLDLIGMSDILRRRMTLLPPENVQSDLDLAAIFLALNRSGLRDRNVKEAKRQIRQMAQRQSAGKAPHKART